MPPEDDRHRGAFARLRRFAPSAVQAGRSRRRAGLFGPQLDSLRGTPQYLCGKTLPATGVFTRLCRDCDEPGWPRRKNAHVTASIGRSDGLDHPQGVEEANVRRPPPTRRGPSLRRSETAALDARSGGRLSGSRDGPPLLRGRTPTRCPLADRPEKSRSGSSASK